MRGGVSVSEMLFSLTREDRLIMNVIIKENIENVNHQEVLEAAKKAEPKVRELIKNLIIYS